jgi:hypothetical protein
MKFGDTNNHGGTHKGGRPVGARNKFQAGFLRDLAEAWERDGAAALKVMVKEDPSKFVQVCAALMPRELAVEHSELGDLSDDDVAALLDHVREARAKLIEHNPRMIEADKKRPRVLGTLPTETGNGQRNRRREASGL